MDENLRKLERIFQESGSLEDEARLLRERVRVGILTQEQIELASYLEYPAAREITPTPITICSILSGSSHSGDIAEAWEAALDPPEVLFAAMLVVAKEITDTIEEENGDVLENVPGGLHPLWDGPGGPARKTEFLSTLNRGLRAATLAFANNSYPDHYGFDGQIYNVLGHEYRRSRLYFALMCIYNLCEALNAYYLNRNVVGGSGGYEEQIESHARMTFFNALEFFSYEREWLCRRIGEQLVPWLLSEWPPTPRRFVELNFDVELE